MLDAAIDLASRNLTDPETPFNMFQDAITSLSFPEVSRLFAMVGAVTITIFQNAGCGQR